MSVESLLIESRNDSEDESYDCGELPFHIACQKGDLSLVKVFLAQGFDMNVGDNFGTTGFHYACIHGKLNVVQFLLQEGFDMNVRDYEGETGFYLACSNRELNVAQFLLQQGFDMYGGDDDGLSSFHLACENNADAVHTLLQLGFDMNTSDYLGYTGFHFACIQGCLRVVKFLIQKGIDMNVRDGDGDTGFHDACLNGNVNVVQFLVQQGFEGINEVNSNGKSGLETLITCNDRYTLSNNELFMPCLLLLIEAGAQLNEHDLFEELISAIKNRIIEITFMKQILFEKWTGRIAQAITDFTIDPFTNTSLQNLSQFLD